MDLWLAALADPRVRRGTGRQRKRAPFPIGLEVVLTATWFRLLAGLGVVVAIIELRYPAL